VTDHDSMHTPTARRGFLRGLATASAAMLSGVASAPSLLHAAPVVPAQDDDWMRALTGKHRTVFDAAVHRNGWPLHQAMMFLDGWRDAFHVAEPQVNLVIGVQANATPLLLSDALWSRFHIGERFDVVDPATKAPATKNLFSASNVTTPGLIAPEKSVESLQKRGVRFLMCLNTIGGLAGQLSAAGLGAPADVRSALIDGLLPGVITVPAMVVALAQLQEHGLTYYKVT
jgi:intracellular sulfur oxidation DsrE/DsrF family protein